MKTIKIKDLKEILNTLPEDAMCYAYDGEVIGIVVWDKDGNELGYIPATEYKGPEEKAEFVK